MGKFHPRFIMADAGYSSSQLVRLMRRQYKSEPVIQTNRSHRKLMLTRGVWENTLTWKTLYAQRQAVERAFSRLKGLRSLNHITVRGLRKVTLHCYLSLIAMQVA
jgi:transposase